jgi:hypothetical protein
VLWTSKVYASFAIFTAETEWLVMRPVDAAFDYMEGFASVTSDDPTNGVHEQWHVPTAVAEIVMISIGLHRHLITACAASGKRFIIFGFYVASGDRHDKAATVLLPAGQAPCIRAHLLETIVREVNCVRLQDPATGARLGSAHARARQGLRRSAQPGGRHAGTFGIVEGRMNAAGWT